MKRGAERQLTKDDELDDAEEQEENSSAGFRRAQQSELQNRPIRGLPKRLQGATNTSISSSSSFQLGPTAPFKTGPDKSLSSADASRVLGGSKPQFVPAGLVSLPMQEKESSAVSRPGSPTWSNPNARAEFDGSEPATKYDLVRHGLNMSLLKALQDLLKSSPTQNLEDVIPSLMSTYSAHRQALESKFNSVQSEIVERSNSGQADHTVRPPSSATSALPETLPTIAPPAPPSGPLIFGGKLASFAASPASSSLSSMNRVVGGPSPPTGGFAMFGATKAPGASAFSSAIPTFPSASSNLSAGDQLGLGVKANSKPPSISETTMESSSVVSSSDLSKPKLPSPFVSQPPTSAGTGITANTMTTNNLSFGTTTSSGSGAFGFSSFSTQSTESGSSGSSSGPNVRKPTAFTFPGNTAPGSQSFGFGKPAIPMATGFTFGGGVFSPPQGTTLEDARVKESQKSAPSQTALLGPSPASTAIGTRDATPEPEGEGEENEITIHETRCKLYQAIEKPDGIGLEWGDRGVGSLRLKRDKDSAKRRLLFRQEGTSRVQLNFYLFPTLHSTVDKKVVSFTGLEDGKPSAFRMRCKTEPDANAFSSALQQEVESLTSVQPTADANEQQLHHVPLPSQQGSYVSATVTDKIAQAVEPIEPKESEKEPAAVDKNEEEGEEHGDGRLDRHVDDNGSSELITFETKFGEQGEQDDGDHEVDSQDEGGEGDAEGEGEGANDREAGNGEQENEHDNAQEGEEEGGEEEEEGDDVEYDDGEYVYEGDEGGEDIYEDGAEEEDQLAGDGEELSGQPEVVELLDDDDED